MSSQDLLAADRQNPAEPGRVLAGFDAAGGFAAALEWARREAVARGAVFEAVESSSPLIQEAGSNDLLVLAASGSGSASAALLGSLARRAVRRSVCPVVVVRGEGRRPIRRIVVGVDGSNASAAALDWACAEADLHGAALEVVHSRERDFGRAEAGCLLDLAVNECRFLTGATVNGSLAEGSPAATLISMSKHADIVAVGSRGRSGFKTRLFGSVALSVAEGADCPVAVTHPRLRLD